MSTARPTPRHSSVYSVSVRKLRHSATVAYRKNQWRWHDDEFPLAAVGGTLPLSARAASASVPSDALTAATPRNDQRIAANNSGAVAISRPPARNMRSALGGPPRRWGGVGLTSAQ